MYDRHLVFDRAIDPKVASARERFEAASHAVRDVLAQRWVKTKTTYEQQNAKRIYYLSMEFLLGRSLTNNLTNLLLDPVVQEVIKEKGIPWPELIEQEPDAGLGNGGLGRLAACFLDSMATMQLPGTGYGLRYEYGMFRQSFVNGWQQENPDNWLRDGDSWEICRQHEKVDIKLNVTFKLRDGRVQVIPGRPSTLFGIPFDRPVVGHGGKTINTLRLWAAAAADFFDFQEFGTGDFVGALGGTLEAESLTRVLYPDDSTTAGQNLRFVQEYFLVACSLADLIRQFLRHNNDWGRLPEKAAIQLNDTHPSLAVAEMMRILLDDAHLGWDEAWDLTRKTLAYTNHTLLPEALEKWPVAWFEVLLPRQLEIIYEINRRLLDEVRVRFPNDQGRVERISLVEEDSPRKIRMANLAIAEITARTGKDPGQHYQEITAEFGTPYYTRIDAPSTPEQRARLSALSPDSVKESELAGEPITAKLTRAPGNQAPIGGLKVVARNGWFAARPSGTENIYKIYAESFKSASHLHAIVSEAEQIVNNALGSGDQR
jgi:starch phosphorylase